MNEAMRRDLADLAEQVRTVDLRDRALTTSRRITVRRRAMAVTAVAVTMVLAGTAVVLRPDRGPTVAPITPTPSLEPSPSPVPTSPPAPTVADTASHPPASPRPPSARGSPRRHRPCPAPRST